MVHDDGRLEGGEESQHHGKLDYQGCAPSG